MPVVRKVALYLDCSSTLVRSARVAPSVALQLDRYFHGISVAQILDVVIAERLGHGDSATVVVEGAFGLEFDVYLAR